MLGVWLILPAIYNNEHQTLDADARAMAPGQFIHITRGFTHYQKSGPDDGPVVLLVHGFSVPAYIWEPTSQMLSQAGYRVVRFDLFGRGYSDRPDATYNGELFEQQLSDLIEQLQLTTPLDVFGLSMGGAIATNFAAHQPEKVRRLVLLDPSHKKRENRSIMDLPVIGEFLMDVVFAPGFAEGQSTDFVEPERFPGWPDKFRVQMQYKGFKAAILSTMRNYFHEDIAAAYAEVGKLNKPVLLIWGTEDATIPFSESEGVRQTLNAEFLGVEKAGHLPHYERPEIVNPVILEFLARGDKN